jgi:hypothetical protein
MATMQTAVPETAFDRYARCVEVSKRVRWEIDRDVFRGRELDFARKFLPDGLSGVRDLAFLSGDEQRLASQVQGRTYANMFGLVERFISAKMVELGRDHRLGDQAAFEALVRFTDEELKHQELFRRLEAMTAAGMPDGYGFVPRPDDVAQVVLGRSTWAVLGLTCHIELFTQAHYRQSIEADGELSQLWKDVFRHHWLEESQHAILDELEWVREDAQLTAPERERGVADLIQLVGAVDAILQTQAAADSEYFIEVCRRGFSPAEADSVRETFLEAYRWQYIGSGATDARFLRILGGLVDEGQAKRIRAALQPILGRAGGRRR